MKATLIIFIVLSFSALSLAHDNVLIYSNYPGLNYYHCGTVYPYDIPCY
jgi:hypothetical protein